MTDKKLNQELWNSLHKMKRHQLVYPSELVVRFISELMNNYKIYHAPKVLDAGCGAGRHVVAISEMGCDAYGIDYSSNGIKATRKLLKRKNLDNIAECNIVKASLDDIPFEDEFFDAVVCYGVLYYMAIEDIEKAIKEFYRVLKPGGKILVYVRTLENYTCNTKVMKDILNNPEVENKENISNEGVYVHYFSKSEVESLMDIFNNIDISTEFVGYDNNTHADINFIVKAEK